MTAQRDLFNIPLLSILWISGCAHIEPYAEIGLSHPIVADYWVHPDRSWTCSSPWFDAEAGIETENGLALGVYHLSAIQCGGHNNKPEVDWTGVRISKRWSGWR